MARAHDRIAAPSDLVLAISSPPGVSALCVLRLSGSQAIEAVATLAPAQAPLLRACRGFTDLGIQLCLAAGQVQARAQVYRAPRSYTREDLIELIVPGSPPLVQLVARALLGAPGDASRPQARWAEPGELTLRAFLNGRIDLEQAEAVASLIAATGEAEAKAAQRSLRGELGARLRRLLEGVIESLALIEATLDFPDEDLPEVSSRALGERLRAQRAGWAELRSSCVLRLPDPGTLRVVLWGLPNAGKSSLLNAIFGRSAALASPVAGTTRDPVRGVTQYRGRRIEWIDVAGTLDPSTGEPGGEGDREAALWKTVRRLTEIEVAQADLVLWVVDPTGDLEASRRGLERLQAARQWPIIQKADLLSPAVEERLLGPLATAPRVSAHGGTGLAELLERVVATFTRPSGSEGGPPTAVVAPAYLLSARQEAHLERVDAALARSEQGLLEEGPLEFVAADLRDAKNALEELVGVAARDAVLDLVFARFCIGK